MTTSATETVTSTGRTPSDTQGSIPPAFTESVTEQRWIRYVAWTVLLALGALQAWSGRHTMNPDGISYLDLAGAMVRGDFGEAVNAYWSPLYPTFLAIALFLTRPSPFWEFTVAHAVNFAIFVLALAAFEFFLAQALTARARLGSTNGERPRIPPWVWRTLGYAAFGWAALALNGLQSVTPDLMIVAIVFACVGIILRLTLVRGLGWFAALGVMLAIGYLTKGAMLPLSGAMLAAAWCSGHSRRNAGIALACAAFAIVAGPFVAALSIREHRLTVGDTGKLNYAWFVNDVQLYKHWHGDPAGTGVVRNPTLVLPYPATYEFAEPVKGTYPLWYDPSHWHDGLVVRFSVVRQLRKIAVEVKEIPWILVDLFVPLVALVVLYRRNRITIAWRALLMLGIPTVATIGMYTLVHIEPRFLAGFVGVFVAGLLLFVRPRSEAGSEAVLVVVTAFAVLLSVRLLELAGSNVRDLQLQSRLGDRAHEQWVTATALQHAGLPAGSNIALIGDSFRSYWAHVADYRITGEVAAQQYLVADPTSRASALHALAATGVDAILADTAYACTPDEGWILVPQTGLCSLQPLDARDGH